MLRGWVAWVRDATRGIEVAGRKLELDLKVEFLSCCQLSCCCSMARENCVDASLQKAVLETLKGAWGAVALFGMRAERTHEPLGTIFGIVRVGV